MRILLSEKEYNNLRQDKAEQIERKIQKGIGEMKRNISRLVEKRLGLLINSNPSVHSFVMELKTLLNARL